MSRAEELRRIYLINLACGDISEAEEAKMLDEIAAAEAVEQEPELENDAA